MILVALISTLVLGGLLAMLLEKWVTGSAKWVGLVASLLTMSLAGSLWIQYTGIDASTVSNGVFMVFKKPWIPEFGIEFHLEVDGLGLVMVMLTGFLGLVAVLISWSQVKHKEGFYYLNLLWTLAGIMGVFLAFDLFLFYLFWEVMLVPMYFLISIWGSANRIYAAYKFFIYTQIGGLLMLVALLGLYFLNGSSTGVYSFNYWDLIKTVLTTEQSMWLMWGFLIAFLIKLPVLPLHNWLPDAHGEAPTAGSVILAGLLLKTGAYGILRFVVPFFPDASQSIAMPAMILGVCGILYGAKLAFAQTDMKRLVAYTSVSHMGFVIIGIFAFNQLAWQGVIMQLVAHGLSTGALFVLAGILYQRTGTRDIRKYGGLWATVPRMGVAGLILVLASLGLPGLANFVAEFMTLAGTFTTTPIIAIAAAIGLIAAAVYSLRIMQKVFYGQDTASEKISDLSSMETLTIATVVFLLIYLGLNPGPITRTVEPSIKQLISQVETPDKGGFSYRTQVNNKSSSNGKH